MECGTGACCRFNRPGDNGFRLEPNVSGTAASGKVAMKSFPSTQRGLFEQRLTRFYARENHGPCGAPEMAVFPRNARVARVFQIAHLREIGAEMRTARVFARHGCKAYRVRHEQQVLEIQPVVPGQIKCEIAA